MHLKIAFFFAVALVTAASRFSLAEDDLENGRFQPKLLLEIADAVLDNHIEPPAKQQMILLGVRALIGSNERMPDNFSRKVSKLVSNEDFLSFLESVRSEYVTQENDSAQQANFIRGMLSCVAGRATWMSATDAKVDAQLEANRYVGIGISLVHDKGLPHIRQVTYGGSGYKAGVLPDDYILAVNGNSTKEKELDEVVKELRGEDGTEVTLTLQQPDKGPRTLTIVRQVTFIPTIEGLSNIAPGKWEYTLKSAPDVAVLKFLKIGPSTPHELKKIEEEFRYRKFQGVVLDFRKASGTLHDITLLADQLLNSGTMGSLRTASCEFVHTMQPGCLWNTTPLVAVVDSSTSAGPTYLAAALQDCRRAEIVGDIPGNSVTGYSSYAQSRFVLTDGSSLQLATGLLHRANGIPLKVNKVDWETFAGSFQRTDRRSELPFLLPNTLVKPQTELGKSETGDYMLENAINEVLKLSKRDAK